MITYGNFKLTGIKERDITPEIDDIINSATKFIIICGYNFASDRTVNSTLHKLVNSPVKIKHCILPIKLLLPNGPDVNRDKAKRLISRGISVSIEDLNHSKWIMSEKGIYYGSANFSKKSLTDRIEVVSFKDFEDNDPIFNDFGKFSLESMKRMFSHSDRRKLRSVLLQNDSLIRTAQSLVKRYNPSIQKVVQTVESYETIKDTIIKVLGNCYWYLDDTDYYELNQITNKYLNLLNSINRNGLEILRMHKKDNRLKQKIKYYNQRCDEYTNSIDHLNLTAKDYLKTQTKLPRQTIKNKRLIKKSSEIIEEILKLG